MYCIVKFDSSKTIVVNECKKRKFNDTFQELHIALDGALLVAEQTGL